MGGLKFRSYRASRSSPAGARGSQEKIGEPWKPGLLFLQTEHSLDLLPDIADFFHGLFDRRT